MVSCQKGPTRHAYAWQIGPFWQDTLDMCQWIGLALVPTMACLFTRFLYLKQCWVIWPLETNVSDIWFKIQNMIIFIHENASAIIACDMAAILSRVRWVQHLMHPIYRTCDSTVNMSELHSIKTKLCMKTRNSPWKWHQGRQYKRGRLYVYIYIYTSYLYMVVGWTVSFCLKERHQMSSTARYFSVAIQVTHTNKLARWLCLLFSFIHRDITHLCAKSNIESILFR